MTVFHFWIALVAYTLASLAYGQQCVTCSQSPPQSEINSLLALYASTTGNHWTVSWNLSTGNPCGGWHGVSCCSVKTACHVVEVQLSANNLAGSIPSTIGDLSLLQSLDLYLNKLTGSIPSTIGNLSVLQSLDLGSNKLAGSIPSTIGNLSLLQVLDLDSNSLTGSIPSTIGNLSMLRNLYLDSNSLNGTIPPTIGDLSMLQYLYLYSNSLTGSIPPTIGYLSMLQDLYLYSNKLTGTIPPTIGYLSMLQDLNLNSNKLTGAIPSTIGYLSMLQDLNLNLNKLTGTIPSTIGNLSMLQDLNLNSNKLTGTIPSTIGDLSALQDLFLGSNKLTGTIPSTIGNLSMLQVLDLDSNKLAGSIPSTIGYLSMLRNLYLDSNALTGSIPSTIGDLSKLQNLYLDSNSLTGSIPPTIGYLSKLRNLYLGSNKLTGSIPSTIGYLSMLRNVNFGSNSLSGSIPPTIGDLSKLVNLYLNLNALTGTIPPTIGDLSKLQYLYLDSNALTGPVPSAISGCTQLFYFYVSSNYLSRAFSEALPKALTYFFAADCLFTGMVLLDGFSLRELSVESNLFSGLALRQIPPQLQYLSVADNRIPSWSPAIDMLLGHPFVFLDLSRNRLNASLPATVWNTSVQQLLLNSNGFSGTFPDRGDRVCSMRYLSVAGNGLWGSLPVDLQQCANLTTFFASDMQLTGSLWGRFATQRWLQVVVVSNNSLTGPLDDVFAASSASGLILNAAYNAFSGTLPVASLRTGLYKSLILTSNCLSGTLPGDALCANGNLTELILSGLHSAASCRYDVFPTLDKLGVYSSYVEASAVGGTVPSCVFDGLSQLTYLALSGNALTGALPGEVRLPETLQGLDLSHNQLTGTIAAGIVAANLTLLDLSFNRLSGTISAQASDVYVRNPAARVSLEVNELSGTLPRSWVEAVDISVLDGNLFACEVGHIGQTANRPLHDPRQATYACGSSTTNVALVVTLAVGVGVALVLLWVRWRGASAAWAVWRSVVDAWSGVVGPWRVDALALLVYLVGSLVVYAVLTATTTVYAETYVWSVSLALQRGGTAGVVALGWLGWLVWTSSGRHTRSAALLAAKTSSSSPSSSSVSYGRMATAVLMVGTVHVLPVLVVNLVYVYTTTLRLSGWVQAAVVLLMSVFKAAWNALVNVYMASDAHAMGHLLSSTHHGVLFVRQLLLWCGLINLIVSPVVTEALVSPDCFRYLFARIQTNSYSIAGGTCYWISYESATTGLAQAIPCLSYAALQQTYNNNVTTHSMIIISTTSNGEASTVDYQAGFAYNYQCSFSLLQAFVYVFVYKYVLSTAMLPWVWWRLKRWQTWAYVRGGLSSAWYRWTTLCLPPMMKLVDSVEVDGDDEDGQAMESNRVRLAHWAKVDQVKKCEMWLSLRLTGDLAVALSFGVLFPLLGLLALMGIGSEVLQTLWMVQRLRAHVDRVGRRAMSMAAGSGRSTDHRPALDDGAASGARMAQRQWTEYHRMAQEQLDALETVVPSSLQSMVKNLLTVQCFAAVTWALTLYDIVGRAEGSVTSLWILVVTLTMPWWMMVLWQATRSLWTSSSRELPAIDEGDKGAVQLMEVTASVNLVAV